ncbi:hypothetical protein [Endomicrobium proavitum]|uniref:Putative lipoprotein n=1 Tax=Endomicrobium proavitum TaxID=1408281 RepID=A0A0G3WKJ2_9BACT|nr:hypothetical protein [Endomicrobium proavitum]AKL98425.1 putative lipoprotein [Endomicrobium proavitum]
MTVEDIKDHDKSRSYDIGISVSAGQFSEDGKYIDSKNASGKNVKITLLNDGKEKEQINRATIGKGAIKTEGAEEGLSQSEAMQAINRDLSAGQEITKDVITNQLKAELSIDLRMATSEGRASIIKDFKDLDNNIEQIGENLTKNNIVVQSIKAALNENNDLDVFEAAKLYAGIDKKQALF